MCLHRSQFDHTSMLATAKNMFGLGGFLTERDAWAGSFEEVLLDVPREENDMPMHLPEAPAPASPWLPWPPRPSPAPAPTPKPYPLPAGKKWDCHNQTSIPATNKNWKPPGLNITGIDYTHGFTDMASCQAVCNGASKMPGENGKPALALEFHFNDRHCVCYSGKSLTTEQFNGVLKKMPDPKDRWTACMLVPDVSSASAPIRGTNMEERRRLVTTDQQATPQHCSQAAVPPGACEGPHVVTQKQLNQLELYSALTQAPKPNVAAMDYIDMDIWLRERWHDYMAILDRS